MNFLVAFLGLLGATFAVSGRSSSDSDTTVVNTVEPGAEGATSGDETPDDEMPDDETPGGDHSDHSDDQMHGHMDAVASFIDITEFGVHHGTSSHTHHDSLEGGRTPITTEAMEVYNGLRNFLGYDPVDLETVGEWAFANGLTNNAEPFGDDLQGVGLYYAMQGAKVGWIADEHFDPQFLADIQRTARLGEPEDVLAMVEANALDGFTTFLEDNDLTEHFLNTLKMEPHYGGWMHGRTHGYLEFDGADGAPVAIAHDLNHLTVLSHDQTQPFMNDTFDYPQWPALDAPDADVANYFQSMVTLGDPMGEGIETPETVEPVGALHIDVLMLAVPEEVDTLVDEEDELVSLL